MATLNFTIERHLNRDRFLLYIRYDHKGKKALFSTGHKVSIDEVNWVSENGREKIKSSQPLNKKYVGFTHANRDLVEQFVQIQQLVYEAKRHGDLTPKAIRDLFEKLTFKSKSRTVVEGIDLILDNSVDLSQRSKDNYDRNLRKHINGFDVHQGKQHLLSELDYQYENSFKSYLKDIAKLSENSIDNQIKYIKSLSSKLQKLGVDVNPSVQSFRRKRKKIDVFALSAEELQQLIDGRLTSIPLNNQKDVFVFQCFTGLRIGDLRRFSKDWIYENRIHTISEKTGTEITIPLLPEARKILDKHDFKLPIISEQKYNKSIHEFLRILGMNRMIVKRNNLPLHQVATSHTARKTFISYAHNKLGLSVSDISEITGTSKETIMTYYLKSEIGDVERKIDQQILENQR